MKTRIFTLLGAAAFAVPALASDQPGTVATQWKEELSATVPNSVNDAGQLLAEANLTRGAGPLTTINGTHTFLRDVDMYAITINQPTLFSAQVNAGQDTYLALFSSTGNGIAYNDNNPDLNPTPGSSGTFAKLSSTFVTTPGVYYLAIGRVGSGGRYVRPMSSATDLMFAGPAQGNTTGGAGTERNVEFGPINPSATLFGYETAGSGFEPFNFNYTITLAGATYYQVPAPGAAALLGLGGLLISRRRR